MPPSLPLPRYGNNLRLNAPTCVNKQAPIHRGVSTDIHIDIVNIDEDVLNPFSQFSHHSLQFPSFKGSQQRIPLLLNVNNGITLEKKKITVGDLWYISPDVCLFSLQTY